MSSTFVIVGTGPAGLAAAKSFRQHDEQSRVVLIGAEPHPPYGRPPLTKDFLRGEITPDELWLMPHSWYAEHDVELMVGRRVRHVDAARRLVRLDGDQVLAYDDVLLATGSRPRPLDIPGGDHPELIPVRDLTSGHRLRALATGSGGRVGVIGSGFIGCEVAANLAAAGRSVVMITGEEQPQAKRLGPAAAAAIAGWLDDAGVEVRAGAPVTSVERVSNGWRVTTATDDAVEVDELVCGGGAEPRLELGSGPALLVEGGGIAASDAMRTQRVGVLVAGDIAYALNRSAGRHLRVEHWGDAETQGEIAGATVAGAEASWDSPPGFWTEIGDRVLKYAAWGDGWDRATQMGSPDAWSVWYGRGEEFCGVLSHNDDAAYERGQQLLRDGANFDQAVPR